MSIHQNFIISENNTLVQKCIFWIVQLALFGHNLYGVSIYCKTAFVLNNTLTFGQQKGIIFFVLILNNRIYSLQRSYKGSNMRRPGGNTLSILGACMLFICYIKQLLFLYIKSMKHFAYFDFKTRTWNNVVWRKIWYTFFYKQVFCECNYSVCSNVVMYIYVYGYNKGGAFKYSFYSTQTCNSDRYFHKLDLINWFLKWFKAEHTY